MTELQLVQYTRHHDILRKWSCCVSGKTPVTIHHCHGGSMKALIRNPGMGQRQNHFLVIPLHVDYHTGDFGIDNGMGFFKGVEAWEEAFGTQLDHLCEVAGRIEQEYGYSIWQLAGVGRDGFDQD